MNHRLLPLTLATALAAMPAPSEAIAPALLVMFKQIAQQVATSMVKDTLLSGLRGMGCKGIALSNALTALDLRGGGGGANALAGGLPKMPAGMGMPTMPPGMGMPTMPPGMGMPAMPPGMGMPAMPPGMGMPNMPNIAGMPGGVGMPIGGLPHGMPMPPEFAARMGGMVPNAGQLPPGMAMDPEQMAMMARAMQAMNQPLSPAETLTTIDELFELGFLPKTVQTEFKECMVLVPASIQALGMGMGMMKPMIPQLRQARAELYALSPAEQDEVGEMLAGQISALPTDQRAALLEYLDSGFFPPRAVQGAKAGIAAAPK